MYNYIVISKAANSPIIGALDDWVLEVGVSCSSSSFYFFFLALFVIDVEGCFLPTISYIVYCCINFFNLLIFYKSCGPLLVSAIFLLFGVGLFEH